MSKRTKSQLAASSTKKKLAKLTARAAGTSERSQRTTKQSRIVAMLRSPDGASIASMMKATAWQQHSVRGFLAGVIRKRLRLKLESHAVDGKRIYRIVGASAKRRAIPKSKNRPA